MAPATERTAPRVDGSMSLLVDMTSAALDPSYADAAARRSAGPSSPAPGGGPRGHRWLLLLLAAAGVVAGVAIAQTRQHADDAGAVRRSLVNEVRRQTKETDRLDAQAQALRREVQQVRDRALGEDDRGRAAAAQVSALELVTGGVAVHGPGLVVTLQDAPDAADAAATDRGGQLGSGRIFDRDIQDVVNALWAAGAEAISVNGQRLTAETAIRSAGEAILVDFRPLSPPYVLKAVGDVDAMEPAFADGQTARRFKTWTSLYGLGFDVTRGTDLRLPAAGAPDLRVAKPEVHP